jgi:hypothetical protein
LEEFKNVFTRTVEAVHKHLGNKPFHVYAGLNAAIYDSVFTAFASHTRHVPSSIRTRFRVLTKNKKYIKYVEAGTTDKDIILKRLALARKTLFKG